MDTKNVCYHPIVLVQAMKEIRQFRGDTNNNIVNLLQSIDVYWSFTLMGFIEIDIFRLNKFVRI